jgi:hypothetical protein
MASSFRGTRRVPLSVIRVRQGRYGRHALWMLLVSTALAALALFGALTWRAPELTWTQSQNADLPTGDRVPARQDESAAR